MSRRARCFAAMVPATMAFVTTICADGARPTVRVMLRNDVNVPPETVQAAQEAVRLVFHAAGVDVIWTGPQPIATVALISRERAHKMRQRPEVLGVALVGRGRRGRMAYVFVHRVNELSARYRLDASVILGAVMAHELGHLLLPFDSHSEAGLMRPLLDGSDFKRADRGELLFTAAQAEQIRSATVSRASF